MKKSTLALLLMVATSSNANDWIDPVDGKVDASRWLLDNAYGFMPFPIMLTDPDIGNGGGAALLFFHETDEQKRIRKNNPEQVSTIAPSVSGLVAIGTDKGSKIYGGFHNGVWKNDSIRYEGGAYKADLNMNFYGFGDTTKMHIDGLWFYQKIDFRIARSNWWIGADYNLKAGEVSFGSNKDLQLDNKDSTLGLKVMYDSRNNTFSPEQGIKAFALLTRGDRRIGGHFDYSKLETDVQSHHKLGDKWIASWRTKTANTTDGIAFYNKPSIDLRGISNMRYQGTNVYQGEVQLAYKIDSRWSVLAFGGLGTAFDDGEKAKVHDAGGMGFRHLVARQLGLKWGVDLAQSRNESTITLQFGGAW